MANTPAQETETELAHKRLARREAAYEKLCVTIERWQRKLDKADRTVQKSVRTIAKLERQRSRARKAIDGIKAAIANELVTTQAQPKQVEPAAISVDDPNLVDKVAAALDAGRKQNDGLDIPAILDRKLQAMPDPRTKEKKAERRAVEREKREAELTGKRRKMPLSGKAALEAIRKGGDAR
jgi:hypothetical protein